MKYVSIAVCLSLLLISCKNEKAKSAGDRLNEQRMALLKQLTGQVKQYPDSAGLRMRLVNTMDSLEMYREALSQNDSLLSRDSLNNGLWFSKAQLQESNKDTQQAIESYRKAINIYPSVDAQLSLANLYAEKKDRRVLQICQSVAGMGFGRETDAHCAFLAGVYYARTGNSDKAISLFDQCINDNYTYMEAYMEKGFVYFDTKKYKEAIQVFQRAVTVNNLYADAYYWQAKCYEAMGNKPQAILNYQRSLGLDKNLKEAAEALQRLE